MKWYKTKPSWASADEAEEIIMCKTRDNKIILESRKSVSESMDKKEIIEWALGEWDDSHHDEVKWMTEGTSPHMSPRSDCG